MVPEIQPPKMDKSAFSIASTNDESDERAYWLGITPEERVAAVELLRQVIYGYDPVTTRLQRVFTIAEFVRS
ncbi:MAG: hypothetical protein ACKO0V_07845 [bacterium]